MAHSKYLSTRETTNLARLSRIVLGPCTDVLRAILRKEIPISSLSKTVKTFLAKAPKQKTSLITKEQESLINTGNYSDFDISLLYVLLRNITQIQPHINKWGKTPRQSDRSVSANIERIRLIRNDLGHISKISISDHTFNTKWQDISDIVRELDTYLSTPLMYHDSVVELKTCSMDDEQQFRYIKELLNVDEKLLDLSAEIQKIGNACVPKNVKEIFRQDIARWKEDDKRFVESHSFPYMLVKARNQPFVTFVGVPGSGKTATARHIALILQKEGYEILPIADKNKIEDYCDPHKPQVFVIDDVIGEFGLKMEELNALNKYQDRLRKPTMSETKFIMTCREMIYRNETVSSCFLFESKNLIMLHSVENALNDHDKLQIFAKYDLEKNLLTSENLASSSNMFPYLCKLFCKEKNSNVMDQPSLYLQCLVFLRN